MDTNDLRVELEAYEASTTTGATAPKLLVPNLVARLMVDDRGRVVAKQANGKPSFDQHGNPVTATDLAYALKADPDFAICWRAR